MNLGGENYLVKMQADFRGADGRTTLRRNVVLLVEYDAGRILDKRGGARVYTSNGDRVKMEQKSYLHLTDRVRGLIRNVSNSSKL